jgi:hypothetical protein
MEMAGCTIFYDDRTCLFNELGSVCGVELV